MGYSLWDRKELDTTERLTHTCTMPEEWVSHQKANAGGEKESLAWCSLEGCFDTQEKLDPLGKLK